MTRYRPTYTEPKGLFGVFPKRDGASYDYATGKEIKETAAARQLRHRLEEANSPESVRLKSGRYIVANCGIVGIDHEGGLFNGYDGSIDATWNVASGRSRPLTRAEKRELADIMIARWRAFKAKQGAK